MKSTDGRKKIYNEKWDSYYYADNGEWVESHCGDMKCELCTNRPENALETLKAGAACGNTGLGLPGRLVRA